MSLNFPASPSNGDTYENYVYDATAGVWKRPSYGVPQSSNVAYSNSASGLAASNVQDAIDEVSESSNVAYSNSASGLSASNVQDAIDEVGGTNTGVSQPATNNLALSTNGEKRIFITDDGSIGFRTENPLVPMHYSFSGGDVSPSLVTSDAFVISAQDTAPGFAFAVAGTSGGHRGVFKAIRARGTLDTPLKAEQNDETFSLLAAVSDGASNFATAAVSLQVDGPTDVSQVPQRIVFQTGETTSRTTRMTVKSNGRVGIGVSDPTFLLELPNSNSDALGRGRANQWATYSDGRVKTDLEEIPYGLESILELRPVVYFQHDSSLDEDGNLVISDGGERSIGFVAQDVLSIIPEIVSVPEDEASDLYSLDYSKMAPVLVRAIQEMKEEINLLNEKIKKLEGGE